MVFHIGFLAHSKSSINSSFSFVYKGIRLVRHLQSCLKIECFSMFIFFQSFKFALPTSNLNLATHLCWMFPRYSYYLVQNNSFTFFVLMKHQLIQILFKLCNCQKIKIVTHSLGEKIRLTLGKRTT